MLQYPSREPFTNPKSEGASRRSVYQNLEFLEKTVWQELWSLVEGCSQATENYQGEILGKKFPDLTFFPCFDLLQVLTTGWIQKEARKEGNSWCIRTSWSPRQRAGEKSGKWIWASRRYGAQPHGLPNMLTNNLYHSGQIWLNQW